MAMSQIDSTHKDPIRTGSLWILKHLWESIQPNEWFTYELEVRGDR